MNINGRSWGVWVISAVLCVEFVWPPHSSFSLRSPTKQSSSQAGSLESSSLTGSLSLGPDLPHCQCCISYEARLKRLSCGHLYCNPCCDQIVNLAFEDIEGLSDYPCPVCKSIRQLGGLVPSSSGYFCGPCGIMQQRQVTEKEHGSRWGWSWSSFLEVMLGLIFNALRYHDNSMFIWNITNYCCYLWLLAETWECMTW